MTQIKIIALLTLMTLANNANAADECVDYYSQIDEKQRAMKPLKVGGPNAEPSVVEKHDDLVKEVLELVQKARDAGCKPPKFMRERSRNNLVGGGTRSRADAVPAAPGGQGRTADAKYMGGLDVNSWLPSILALAGGFLLGDDDDDDGGEPEPEVANQNEVRGGTCSEIASQHNIVTYAQYCSNKPDTFIPIPVVDAATQQTPN